MKSLAFWALDATVLFALSLVYLHQGYHRKNPLFAIWLCNGVAVQLMAAWALAAGPPGWINYLRVGEDVVTYVLSAGVLVTAFQQRACPVNRSLLYGLGAMVGLGVVSAAFGGRLDHSLQIWLRNIAFFGPALFLLITLSNIPLNMLPLWIRDATNALSEQRFDTPVVAALAVFGALRARRR